MHTRSAARKDTPPSDSDTPKPPPNRGKANGKSKAKPKAKGKAKAKKQDEDSDSDSDSSEYEPRKRGGINSARMRFICTKHRHRPKNLHNAEDEGSRSGSAHGTNDHASDASSELSSTTSTFGTPPVFSDVESADDAVEQLEAGPCPEFEGEMEEVAAVKPKKKRDIEDREDAVDSGD